MFVVGKYKLFSIGLSVDIHIPSLLNDISYEFYENYV